MRRFIVIFLLLLHPVQVLAESLEDLRTAHHCAFLVKTIDVVSANFDATFKCSAPPSDASNPQQAVHADIGDSVSSTALYVQSIASIDLWPDYRLLAFPSVYLPVIKPPLI